MLKRFLAASTLTVAIMLSAGAGRLLAQCGIACDAVVHDDYTIQVCTPVWCDDGAGG